jgi:DNA-binding IclR family transcriptional regulator
MGADIEIEQPDAGGKQVIARAVAVLRALENQQTGLSLAQIALAAQLPRTTVHRLVAALEVQQMVVSSPNGIRLGPALVRMAASAHTDVLATIRPSIEALGRRTRETVDICVFRGRHSVSVDQYASDRELRVVSAVGTAFPIQYTAHGKALLSILDDAAVARLLEGPFEARCSNSVTNIDELLAQLKGIRTGSIAIDIEEHAEGVCGIGMSFQTNSSELYAMAIAVPTLRFTQHRSTLEAEILRCKAEIESTLRTK